MSTEPTEPAQQALAVFELSLFLCGVALLLWLAGSADARRRWLGTNNLPARVMSVVDFVLLAVLIFLHGFAFLLIAQLWLGPAIREATDHEGLALVVYSVATYSGAFIGWKFVFPSLRRSWLVEPEAPAPVVPTIPHLPWSRALRYGAATLAVAFPILIAASVGWTIVVKALELPVLPQDVVAIFANTQSPLVIAGMLLIACVGAPIYEELLFRAGLYRFCRQRLGRGWALLISGACFGAVHGNWAGFIPLTILGMVLAIAYEATGSIRVAILAHGLFNLNTVLVLLSGLLPVPPP